MGGAIKDNTVSIIFIQLDYIIIDNNKHISFTAKDLHKQYETDFINLIVKGVLRLGESFMGPDYQVSRTKTYR